MKFLAGSVEYNSTVYLASDVDRMVQEYEAKIDKLSKRLIDQSDYYEKRLEGETPTFDEVNIDMSTDPMFWFGKAKSGEISPAECQRQLNKLESIPFINERLADIEHTLKQLTCDNHFNIAMGRCPKCNAGIANSEIVVYTKRGE
jgi:hypothetical protein